MPEESSAGGAISEIRYVLMDYFSPLAITTNTARPLDSERCVTCLTSDLDSLNNWFNRLDAEGTGAGLPAFIIREVKCTCDPVTKQTTPPTPRCP